MVEPQHVTEEENVMETDDERTLKLATVARDICIALRSYDTESIRPELMPLDGADRHVVMSLVFHQLMKDITTPHLDKIFIKRIKDEQITMSHCRSEVVAFQRELLRIDKLPGYEKYAAQCVLQGIEPWDENTWTCKTETLPSSSSG